MVITICGSTKFKDQMLDAAKKLTLDDHIVLMPTIFEHADNEELTTEQKIRLDNLHRQKISMSDAIFVVNVDGYIGESTFGEIDWASKNKKELYFLVNPNPEEEKSESSTVVNEEGAQAPAPAEEGSNA